jgi:molybdate transport system substrate-binding protein
VLLALARCALFSLLAVIATVPAALAAEVPVVAAASDLQYALGELAAELNRSGGGSVKLALGSSGNFVRQILQGAPFELFFSADEAYVNALAARGFTLDSGALYALGRLAVFVPNGSAVKADAELNDLAAALADGRLRKLAIANPEHAPYGRAARAALMRKGLWEKLQPRLVMGENISQAAQFAVSGSVEAGLIAYSLALAGPMSKAGSYALLPADWHDPLRQRMVLLKGAGEAARRFYAFVQTPAARAILHKYGFSLPAGER